MKKGMETVSVSGRNRQPNFLALDTKINIIKKFRESTKCPFSKRVLLREYPKNIIVPTQRDMQRNACPIHGNFRCAKIHYDSQKFSMLLHTSP